MKSLVTKYPWPLTLLLLLLLLLLSPPLTLQGEKWDYWDYEMMPVLGDYLRELHSTGPTKPPTKERIIEKIIADPERPLVGDDYCDTELVFKNIHNKLLCYSEYYFVAETYQDLQKACYGKQVKCKKGASFCRRSTELMKGVKCALVSGEGISECSYESVFLTGYPVVTCQWDDETQEFIPNRVLDILIPRSRKVP
ncbi:inactive ribonuclease-like protein 9 [Peromyscus eremicus]|uniref:inactive ribonuclease-like protein 9 n=1 Tax=Peromyscus eremicus TaxID=42410 RepID=UPI0027DE764D|nr:inactive ribonuclease-like protein 9 [Peromyscus eremicus]